MTAKEYRLKLIGMKKRYFAEREQIALLSALDTVALMKRRVINKRENADGGIFGIYSNDYQKVRKEKNLLGENVNFSFTNKMWNSTTARVVSVTDAEIVVLISPDAQNAFKMLHNTERFGTILELNKKEQDLHRKIYERKVRDVI